MIQQFKPCGAVWVTLEIAQNGVRPEFAGTDWEGAGFQFEFQRFGLRLIAFGVPFPTTGMNAAHYGNQISGQGGEGCEELHVRDAFFIAEIKRVESLRIILQRGVLYWGKFKITLEAR